MGGTPGAEAPMMKMLQQMMGGAMPEGGPGGMPAFPYPPSPKSLLAKNETIRSTFSIQNFVLLGTFLWGLQPAAFLLTILS